MMFKIQIMNGQPLFHRFWRVVRRVTNTNRLVASSNAMAQHNRSINSTTVDAAQASNHMERRIWKISPNLFGIHRTIKKQVELVFRKAGINCSSIRGIYPVPSNSLAAANVHSQRFSCSKCTKAQNYPLVMLYIRQRNVFAARNHVEHNKRFIKNPPVLLLPKRLHCSVL